MFFFKKHAVSAQFRYRSVFFRGIGLVCLIFGLTSNIFASENIYFSPFQPKTGLNLFDKNVCIADDIPQSVWTAAFGLAQPLCAAGLPCSSSGISHRFESIHERFFEKYETPLGFQTTSDEIRPFEPDFSEFLNDDDLSNGRSTSFGLEIPLFRGQKPSEKPPAWDFSFPTFRSLQRSQDLNKSDFDFYSNETYSIGCFRRSKLELCKIQSDLKNFYSLSNFENILFGFGLHAVISNTAIDQNFRNWYQDHVRTSSGDKLSAAFTNMGNGLWTIPPMVAISCLYYGDKITDRLPLFEHPAGSFLGEFSSRTIRGFLVGTPTLLLGQVLIGAGRPCSPPYQSYWAPFQHGNGISGHAFVGAMPFITLAQMSDNFWLKVIFYTLSTLTAWSRVNDDRHYLSQAMLGWYLSYLSCRAVSKTEYKLLPRGLTVFPMLESNTVGLGLVYQW